MLREKLIREDPPDAGRRLALLNAAHRTLGDRRRREAYDALHAGRHAPPPDAPPGPG